MVNRSRLRSATDEPPRELETPPPNMSDRPPPRPLCKSTSTTSTALVIMRMMVSNRVTIENPTVRRRRSQDRHRVEAADAAELLGLEAGPAHQGAVDVLLGHQSRHVRRLDRAAVEDPDRIRGVVPVHFADALANGG